MTRPAVLGGGSWGTALALVLARRGLPVRLWIHNAELARRVVETRVNDTYLPGFELPENILIGSEPASSLETADVVVTAVPSHVLRSVLAKARQYISPGAPFVSATKGLEEGTLFRMSEVIGQVTGRRDIAVLSGPSFAREVAAEQPTAVVTAAHDPALAQAVQRLFSGSRFRVYTSADPIGVEIGGAMKNVVALGAGICHGLGLGQNALAALVTRGLAEITRLALALGGQPRTLAGLAGLGDLVLTCTGNLSRNRNVGIQLAEGKRLDDITGAMRMVAEGVKTTHSVVQLGKRHNVVLPIAEQMHAVLHSERSPAEAIRRLMERSLREE
ncbi:MAG: NAD(P)-dependent glycerol-3-phosphate dehydrogenase [Acidobacteriota bacterium]|nr:NAD(P)-dependent glycerol-3-phosphate dehydrogenase [Acidobacteriota bacterium]